MADAYNPLLRKLSSAVRKGIDTNYKIINDDEVTRAFSILRQIRRELDTLHTDTLKQILKYINILVKAEKNRTNDLIRDLMEMYQPKTWQDRIKILNMANVISSKRRFAQIQQNADTLIKQIHSIALIDM